MLSVSTEIRWKLLCYIDRDYVKACNHRYVGKKIEKKAFESQADNISQ